MATPRDAQESFRRICEAIPKGKMPALIEHVLFVNTMLRQIEDLLARMQPVESAVSDIMSYVPPRKAKS